MQSSLLDQGLELLIFGMGTVFIFLAILVVAINLMSSLVESCFPEPVVIEPQTAQRKTNDLAVNNTTLAVIQAAIRQHRDKHPRG